MLLNFRQLEVFRAIMIAKTISGAAEILNVTQPGISRLLKYMEYKLGVPLFERQRGRLIPTPEGLELFRELEPIYQRVEGLDDTIKRIISNDSYQCHIACTPSLASVVMPWVFAHIKTKYPDVVLKLETLPNEQMAEYLVQRRVDFGIAFSDLMHPLVQAEPSLMLSLQVILPVTHPLTSRDQLTFADLIDQPFISYYPETLVGKLIRLGFEKLEQAPDVSVMVRYADDACNMVAQGLGLTLAFDYSLPQHLKSELVAIPIESQSQRLYVVRHNEVPMSSQVRDCFEFTQELMARVPEEL